MSTAPSEFDPMTLPLFGENVCSFGRRSKESTSPSEYRVTGDGETDDGPAFQLALDARPQRLLVPPGIYRIGQTLRIGSGTHLLAHPAAEFRFGDGAGVDQNSFLLTNADPTKGDSDITIEGGIWDGNNLNNPRGADVPDAYTGVLLHFDNVRGLVLRDLTLRDPESYFIRLSRVRQFRVEQIRFQVRHIRPNQDGIHLGGFCEDGLIQDVSGFGAYTPSDDVVALNADDANERAQNLGMLCGPIRRLQIQRLRADDCHTFVRLLSVQSPIEDITIEDVAGGCRVAAINLDACRECRVKLFDPADPAFAHGVGNVARVHARNLTVYKSGPGSGKPLIDFRTLSDTVVVENFVRDLARDAAPDVPTLRVAEVPGLSVTLDGLDETQTRALLQTSDCTPLGELRSKSPELARSAGFPESTLRFRANVTLQSGQNLTLPHGGFSQLTVSRPPTPE